MLKLIDREIEATFRDRIDSEELERHIDAFDGLERVSGTEDEWTASEYVVETLTEYGVDATLEEFDAYVSVPEDAELTVTTPTHREVTDAITTSFGASTPAAGIHAEVVHLPNVDAESVANTDITDRIVFTRGLPTPEPVRLLENAGATAVIFESVTPDELHEMIVTPVWGTPELGDEADIPNLPVIEILQQDGAWLRRRLDDGPVEATVTTEVTTEIRTLPCPVGRLEGNKSDRFFLIGNHVDSWYEGLTDNATAMAATLELARIFAEEQPRRGLVFGFWPGHSTGRYAGSAWYADEYWADLRQNGVAYLHLDLNGLRGADSLWYQHMAELGDEHLNTMETASDFPLREDDESFLGDSDRPARNSDQSFWGAGLSSLLSGARLDPGTQDGGPIGGGWWWHTPEDTRDKVDIDVLVEETKLYVSLAARICESPVLPHDYSATAADIRTELDAIDPDDEWFTDVRSELDAFETAITEANEVIDHVDTETESSLKAVEDLQVDLGNLLVPALYTSGSEHHQESALPFAPLPGLRIDELSELTGRELLFAKTTLQREENRLADRLRAATDRIERFID
ncbi:M28 family peptidase [Haladaptatus caseinilyticus]|uniref:M28 family peptidase n=1 Tax=Haladaptatus caseinilyticus TaxID=2993314 RepID=UPI00224A68BB|nr:M28 family peptidase [Haladaptatus caseinilyticus]